MNYYIIKTLEHEESILAAKDDADASNFCKYNDHIVSFTRILIDNKDIFKTDTVWREYLKELLESKKKAEDVLKEAKYKYVDIWKQAPEYIRKDFE
jgi:hypothetical protein